MIRAYQKPNGTLTTDAREYADAWHRAAQPVEELADVTLTGFSPNFQFITPDGQSLALPAWFVLRLNEVLERERAGVSGEDGEDG